MIRINLIQNDAGGHKDLNFQIDGLTEQLTFDSYYFALATERASEHLSTVQAIAQLISFWIMKLESLDSNETIFLPIDFSDQYIGCLRVTSMNGELELNYGYTITGGYGVNPLDPEEFSNNVKDFVAEPVNLLLSHRELLVNPLKSEFNKLKNAS